MTSIRIAAAIGCLSMIAPVARASDCDPVVEATFTVDLPKLGLPPDESGQDWDLPAVWAGISGVTDDSIEVPNGRPIYALIVSGYKQNAYFDELLVYNFARHLMAQGAYVHYAWWNNLLAPYMERPLHTNQSHPGTATDILSFTTPESAEDKAVPGEDYQFLADAKLLLQAIRDHNPSAMIIVVGHSMGGGAVVHLAKQSDVLIDLAAPIDPVNNRTYPWAGLTFQGASHFNWTRWRITRGNFLGYRSLQFGGIGEGCVSFGPWHKTWSEAALASTGICVGQVQVHGASAMTFGSNVLNLYHRWQHENLFPFDYEDSPTFNTSYPSGGSQVQSAVTTQAAGSDSGGWPGPNPGGECCPVGSGIDWPGDGHGEIVGHRGPTAAVQPLAVRVRTSPNCTGCSGLTWPARTFSGGTWGNGNSAARVALLMALETLPLSTTWSHQPYNPGLCLVSQGLISRFNIINKPPVADAGSEQTVQCDGCASASVTLNGSGSVDSDGDALQFAWSWPGGSAIGQVAQVNLPLGTTCVTLEVEDPVGHVDRDVVRIIVADPSAVVVPYTSVATAWKSDVVNEHMYAFDSFYPGVAGATACLHPTPFNPVVIPLTGGTMTVSAHDGPSPYCAIGDSSTAPAVSDGRLTNNNSVLNFEFDPPVRAFYTYFGSLAIGHTGTMMLYGGDGGTFIDSVTTPPSTHASQAAGQGFTSTVPIDRVELSTSEPGGVLVGAFVGLLPGEQSLGTVDLGSYAGPGGSGVIELDFALSHDGPPSLCPADFDGSGAVTGLDLAQMLGTWTGALRYSPCPPHSTFDLNQDCKVNGLDLAVLLGSWGPCP
jgi:pimeloyl-ACP methyl ester carboxylesterase